MKLLILHLSDIHFSIDRNFVASRIDSIVTATTNVDAAFTNVLIALSGDIAAHGKATQYSIASEFIDKLKASLQAAAKSPASVHIEVAVVPGNHDLDLSIVGEEVIAVLAADVVKMAKEPSSSQGVYGTLLKSQDAYLDFQQAVTGRSCESMRNRIADEFRISLGEHTVVVTSLNTAILSQRNETQGSLWFPMETLDRPVISEIREGNQYSILIGHHPDKWLESNNATRFRSFVNAYSDLILIGHQHIPDSFYEESLAGDTTWYSAGDALQDANEQQSGFSIICLDFEQSLRRRVALSWKSNFYTAENDTEWKPFCKNASARAGYVITETFNDSLDNPGNLIIHTQKKKIFLRDIYEPCRLKIRAGSLNTQSSVVSASELPSLLNNHPTILVYGEPLDLAPAKRIP